MIIERVPVTNGDPHEVIVWGVEFHVEKVGWMSTDIEMDVEADAEAAARELLDRPTTPRVLLARVMRRKTVVTAVFQKSVKRRMIEV